MNSNSMVCPGAIERYLSCGDTIAAWKSIECIIGAAVKQGVDPAAGFVVVTSRASFEMVQKAMILGAPLLAAISGPTGLAVRVAEQSGMTLVGFARKDKLTVYTHPDRVVG